MIKEKQYTIRDLKEALQEYLDNFPHENYSLGDEAYSCVSVREHISYFLGWLERQEYPIASFTPLPYNEDNVQEDLLLMGIRPHANWKPEDDEMENLFSIGAADQLMRMLDQEELKNPCKDIDLGRYDRFIDQDEEEDIQRDEMY